MPIKLRSRTALLAAALELAVLTPAALAANAAPPKADAAAPSIETLSGAYLAAKSAQIGGDLDAATTYYARALDLDPTADLLRQDAMFAFLAEGKFDEGVALAAKLRDSVEAGKVARIALAVDLIRRASYAPATAELDILNASDLDALLVTHLAAWADVGDGRVDDALGRIKDLGLVAWYPIFNDYQSGLIASYAGRTDLARGFLKRVVDDAANAQTSPDAFLSSAEALARLEARAGRKADALAAIGKGLALAENYDPLKQLRTEIEAGKPIAPAIGAVTGGAAESLYVLGQAINRGEGQQVATLYFQFARALSPKEPKLLTAMAGVAERANRLDRAIDLYRQIPATSALHRTAELQTGLDLWYAERKDEAKRHLQAIAKSYPDDLQAYTALADVLAADKDFSGAAAALERAVTLADKAGSAGWNLYYQRGIAYERLKAWPKAEADFRKALVLSPDEPSVLNYLGYSWVDMNENLDEGLGMIRKAVDLRPNDGYIIDSLGWAYYRLKRYDDAVEQLERAILLNPVDPTINDHLGDAYWQVGRLREARFQWARSLVGDPAPEAADVARISKKVRDGLTPMPSAADAAPPPVVRAEKPSGPRADNGGEGEAAGKGPVKN